MFNSICNRSIHPLLASPLARGRNSSLPLPRGGLGWGEIISNRDQKMQVILSALILFIPALFSMLVLLWLRKQNWIIKMSSILLATLIVINTYQFYFPDQDLRLRYASVLLSS